MCKKKPRTPSIKTPRKKENGAWTTGPRPRFHLVALTYSRNRRSSNQRTGSNLPAPPALVLPLQTRVPPTARLLSTFSWTSPLEVERDVDERTKPSARETLRVAWNESHK